MSNEVIFWTQLGSVITFIVALFVLYRVLVGTKDATIQLLKEKVSSLEAALNDARASGPDVLVERYAARVKLATEELERLSRDHDKNAEAIKEKEEQLSAARDELITLRNQIERAQELVSDLLCPQCKEAPMMVREYQDESVGYNGRELEITHEYVEYECGLTIQDGRETHPCSWKKPST